MKNCFRLLLFICCAALIFSSCQKEYSNESAIAQEQAEGTLKDSIGNCLPDTVTGTYYEGVTPGTDTAYVEVQVNVTKTGAYNISSDYQNGFEFVDSGFFTNTGINIIRLKPFGTPILPKPTTFTFSFDSSFCNFTVNVQDSTGTGLGGGQDSTGSGDPDANPGDWQFTSNGHTYTGTALSTQDLDTLGKSFLVINSNGFNVDSLFTIVLPMSSSNIQLGTYTTNNINSLTGFELDDLNAGTQLFKADYTTSNAVITIKVVSYDAATKVLTGSFSGTAVDASGNVQTISNGSFSVVVQ